MTFDPRTSKIAVTIPHFRLLAGADSPLDSWSEPYMGIPGTPTAIRVSGDGVRVSGDSHRFLRNLF